MTSRLPVPDAVGPSTPAARRRAARALGDAALAAALATGDDAVWGEFDARFRPLLEAYVRRIGVPSAWRTRCVDDVLADEAMRLSEGARPPERFGAYLVRAAYHAFLKCRREDARRLARHAAAADDTAEATDGPERDAVAAVAGDLPPALAGLVRALTGRLTDAERQLLAWVGEQVPRRQIAAWLGDDYEATRKRIQRLARRLQGAGRQYAATRPPAERHELERFFRRAGRVADVVTDPRPGAARAAGPPPVRLPGRAARPAEDLP